MDDINARILALAGAVPIEADHKRIAFARLKACDPVQAEFVRRVSATFGKPSAITIRFADGELAVFGRFRSADEFDDFRARVALAHRRFFDSGEQQ